MTRGGSKKETRKFSGLSGCIYNDEICFVGIEFIVCYPARDITETVANCLRERSVSSAYK